MKRLVLIALAGLWPGLFITMHGEYRYGDNTNQGGVLSPVNTALLSPRTEGEAFALTSVTITQALSESFLILGVPDSDPNPIGFSAATGLVANGVCPARPCDSFGIGLFYNGVSDDLKDTLSLPNLSNRGIAIGDEVRT